MKHLKYSENYQSMTQTQSKPMLLRKSHQQTCLMQDCHKPSVRKKKNQYLKLDKDKHNKARQAYIFKALIILKLVVIVKGKPN